MQGSRGRLVLLGWSLALGGVSFGPPLLADDSDVPKAPDLQRVRALDKEVTNLLSSGKYGDAAAKCREQAEAAPELFEPRYNLACAMSRLGRKDEALAELARAVELGFDDPSHLAADEDLAGVRGDKSFPDLASRAAANARNPDDGHLVPGSVPHGIRAIDRSPENGLRYRLLVPERASATRRLRLIVWLHPFGAAMNDVISAYAPQWTEAGFAVLLPTQKRWRAWTEAALRRLLEGSLSDVAAVPGVDASRPVLLGFSMGGQAALRLWAADPARFGGIVVVAAYPIDPDAAQRGERRPILPPGGGAAQGTPVFVVVGGSDPVGVSWQRGEPVWRSAGVPVIVRRVPDGTHEWLLRGQVRADLAAWLETVAAGKIPADADRPDPGARRPAGE